MIRCFLIFFQKLAYRFILSSALSDLINSYVLIQFFKKIFRLFSNAEKLLITDIYLGIFCRQNIHDHIDHYKDHYKDHTDQHTVGTVFDVFSVKTGFYFFFKGFFL